MKARILNTALAALTFLSLLATFSTSGAQAPTSLAPPERLHSAISDPPPPESELQMAPLRPGALEPPPPGTGFVPPPMDLSHLTGQISPGGIRPQALPSSFDWRTSGKVTSVKNQAGCGSCYAFASIANFESKLLIDGSATSDFSENNAKECNWYEVNNVGGGASCDGGNYFMIANLFSKKGTVLESCDPYVDSDVGCKSTCPYQKTLLDWRIISGDAVPSTSVLKQYIYDHGPVYTSIYAGDGDPWDTEFGTYDGSYTLYYAGTETPNHAVLIVGWDDSLSHTGGSGGWIVKNSWGTGWGHNGFFTIAYGSASIGKYSSFIYDWQDYDDNGDIWYYDEGGWSASWGGSGTTRWGLAKFIPSSNTSATRVEFWTTASTTDVDVYIYDDFDGSEPTDLLRQSLDHSFEEAGYHSVSLSSPLSLTTGDDVVVVVKFANEMCDGCEYPLPIDGAGPPSRNTYYSRDGSPGSWSEVESGGSYYDVAIRLRTSTSVTPAPTVTSITPNSGFYTETVHITNLAGSNFQSGAMVKLTKSGQSDINATNVTVASASKITCDFDLTGAATGLWNVVVTSPDSQSGTLPNGFTVRAPGAEDHFVYLPLVVKRWPPIPDVPVLNPINNPDGDGNYSVSWGSAYLADTYTLQEDDNVSFSSPTTRYTGSGTSWNATGKAPGTYYYRVKASNSWGDSGWSNVRQVTVLSVPGRPTLNPINNADGDGNYTVSWNAVAHAQTYILQEDDNASFPSPTTRYTGSGTSWNATGKAPGTYYYRVKASNSMGDSGWSNVRQVTVSPPMAEVYVENDTGGELCYKVDGTGIGQKCFSSGTHYYGTFPSGTYTWHASAWCGSASGSQYYEPGVSTHEFWCE